MGQVLSTCYKSEEHVDKVPSLRDDNIPAGGSNKSSDTQGSVISSKPNSNNSTSVSKHNYNTSDMEPKKSTYTTNSKGNSGKTVVVVEEFEEEIPYQVSR